MLATLAQPRSLSSDWVVEPKLDGVRTLARVAGDSVRLVSRNGLSLDRSFPELAAMVRRAVRADALLDGEIVAPSPGGGRATFQRLQRRIHVQAPSPRLVAEVPVELWLFDCLERDGSDLTRETWDSRRRTLERIVRPTGPVRLTPVGRGAFAPLLEDACRRGEEGLIAKRIASRYRHGRSPDWLKLKCVREQELLVGGWTDPSGGRQRFGALLLGYRENGKLRYAGKVGTGFDSRMLARVAGELGTRARADSPFAGEDRPLLPRAHWVEPTLVVQVGFGEWPEGALLRHPRFLGIRSDIDPRRVRRERPPAG
jgi:bifunctional non-homologous end joining protein LigD